MDITVQKEASFSVSTPLPDGNGGYEPCPEVLTEQEAIRYLRLDTVAIKNPAATLRRYRELGLLKGTQISKRVFYLRRQLDSFLQRLTEENPR